MFQIKYIVEFARFTLQFNQIFYIHIEKIILHVALKVSDLYAPHAEAPVRAITPIYTRYSMLGLCGPFLFCEWNIKRNVCVCSKGTCASQLPTHESHAVLTTYFAALTIRWIWPMKVTA